MTRGAPRWFHMSQLMVHELLNIEQYDKIQDNQNQKD